MDSPDMDFDNLHLRFAPHDWANVLYDFDGDEPSGELTIKTGETLIVIRQDIGDGWWEAKNERTGKQGLVPEAYVEVISVPEPSMPPPPPPAHSAQMTQSWSAQPALPAATNHHQSYHNNTSVTDGGWNNTPAAVPAAGDQAGQYEAEWDDDWDDDTSTNPDTESTEQSRGFDGKGTIGRRMGGGSNQPATWSSGFSVFSKSGGDAFLLGSATGTPTDQDKVFVMDTEYGPCWAAHPNPYTCMIASPKKESKFKGMKSFIAYQLTPSFSNIQVSRRYKHFDWLHARLVEKFPCVAVPPLPDKQVTGRYEDDFIAERMRQLQLWVDRMVRHPLVGPCFTMMHFMECGADEKRWKTGKRKAEKDEFQGAKFFLTVQTPAAPLELSIVEQDTDTWCKFTRTMDDNVRHLMAVMDYNGKKHQGPFKREFQKIGASFTAMATGFELDTGIYSGELTKAMHHTGKAYHEIGNYYAQQPFHDSMFMLETLNEYKGLLAVMPDMQQTQRSAVAKVRECQKEQEQGKMSESDLQNVIQRCDTVSYAMMAEQKYFQLERVADYKLMMQSYLRSQIEFYKKITAKLEENLQLYDNMP